MQSRGSSKCRESELIHIDGLSRSRHLESRQGLDSLEESVRISMPSECKTKQRLIKSKQMRTKILRILVCPCKLALMV